VQIADRRQDMRGIGPLGAPRLDPPPRFAGSQEGIEDPLAGIMDEQAVAKVMQQGEVEPGVGELKAQGLFPIHAAAHRIGRLAVREPFDVLHHDDQRQAPGRHFHGATLGRIEISKELIIIERAKLGAEVHGEIAFGKGSPYCSRCRLWNGWKGFGA